MRRAGQGSLVAQCGASQLVTAAESMPSGNLRLNGRLGSSPLSNHLTVKSPAMVKRMFRCFLSLISGTRLLTVVWRGVDRAEMAAFPSVASHVAGRVFVGRTFPSPNRAP